MLFVESAINHFSSSLLLAEAIWSKTSDFSILIFIRVGMWIPLSRAAASTARVETALHPKVFTSAVPRGAEDKVRRASAVDLNWGLINLSITRTITKWWMKRKGQNWSIAFKEWDQYCAPIFHLKQSIYYKGQLGPLLLHGARDRSLRDNWNGLCFLFRVLWQRPPRLLYYWVSLFCKTKNMTGNKWQPMKGLCCVLGYLLSWFSFSSVFSDVLSTPMCFTFPTSVPLLLLWD